MTALQVQRLKQVGAIDEVAGVGQLVFQAAPQALMSQGVRVEATDWRRIPPYGTGSEVY